MMTSQTCGPEVCDGRPGAQPGAPGEPTATAAARGAGDAANLAHDRIPVGDLILAVLMRTSRPCSPHEIMEVIAGSGFPPFDRQQLTRDIEAELRAADSSLAGAVFEPEGGRGERWGLSPAFTAWLMTRSLASMMALAPGIPLGMANDG